MAASLPGVTSGLLCFRSGFMDRNPRLKLLRHRAFSLEHPGLHGSEGGR